MKREYICIVCPLSCDLVLTDRDGELTVTGNTCKRGEVYGKNEYTNPVRMITTTVRLANSQHHLLPVISSEAVPRDLMTECLSLLYTISVTAPVKAGDVIVKNIMGTGADIVAAKTMKGSYR